jgi:hypothetical protein
MALNYISGRPLRLAPQSHIVLSTVKNEALRLPYFFSYYRALGFEQFITVDNDSSDGTREFLEQQPDVFLFHTAASFFAAHSGMDWVHHILDTYCHGHWVLNMDADELFVWPGSETEIIHDLTLRLDAVRAEAVMTLLIDMYSERPLGQVGYRAGEPFLESCPFFDRGPYPQQRSGHFPYVEIYGGLRARLFWPLRNSGGFHPPLATNVPLVKWRKGLRYRRATHSMAQPLALAPMRGAILHFKMFDTLLQTCADEAALREHYEHGREYRDLAAAIARAPNQSFVHPKYSVRYEGTGQLVSLGLMHERTHLEEGGIGSPTSAKK